MSKAQWYGNVTNVEGDIFTAILRRDGQPDLLADFDMKRCGLADIEPGDCIIVTPNPGTVHGAGRRLVEVAA